MDCCGNVNNKKIAHRRTPSRILNERSGDCLHLEWRVKSQSPMIMNSFWIRSIGTFWVAFFCVGAAFAQPLGFSASERENGSAFFSLDSRTGQLQYMLDYGEGNGVWRKYGSPIGALAGGFFLFDSKERENGSAFFAMETFSGQLYYMLDYGDQPGVWNKYGGPIGKSGYNFRTTERPDRGSAFFAVENGSGQLYYMLDYGDSAGIWQKFGGTLEK